MSNGGYQSNSGTHYVQMETIQQDNIYYQQQQPAQQQQQQQQGNPTTDAAVLQLSIAPTKRWLVILYVIFVIAYAMGAVMMGGEFHNPSAAAGFSCTTLMLLIYIVLARHPPERVQQCSFLARTVQGIVMFGLLTATFLALAIYYVIYASRNHQSYTGSSQYCSMTSFLMAAKWSLACAIRVRHFRIVARLMMERGVYVVGVAIDGSTGAPLQQCPMGFTAGGHQQQHVEQKKLLEA